MEEKTSFKEIFSELRKSWNAPEMIVLWVVVFMVGAILVAQMFYEASIFLFLASLVLFFGVVVMVFYSNLRALNLEQKSSSAAKQLNAVIDNMDEGVVIYNPKFQIIKLNPSAERILGVRKQDVLGKTVSPEHMRYAPWKILVQVIFPSLAPIINQLSSDGWPQITELETNDPNLKLTVTLNRFIDENNEVVSFIKIIKDKTREDQLIKTKNDFITTAAHQLRTPVTAMSWGFEQLDEINQENSEAKSITEEGKSLAARSLKIINDLLSVIQIEEGKFGYKMAPMDIAGLIRKIVDEAKPTAKEYDIAVKAVLPEEEVIITADSDRIISAFSALIENSIMYNNIGGESVISLIKSENKSFVKISISDTGIGISEEELNKIFEKFYRGEKSAQISPNGSGLGLYIAKNIIEAHKGKIEVSSTINRGTVVNVWLPTQAG